MNKTLIEFTLGIVLSMIFPAVLVDAQCTADLLNSFRTRYSKDVHEITASELYSKYCSQRTQSNGLRISLPIDDIPISTEFTSKSQAAACMEHDERYFKYLKKKTELSFLPRETALELARYCTGGLTMVGYEDGGGMHLTAVYVVTKGAYHPAAVQSLTPTESSQARPGNAKITGDVKAAPGSKADFVRVSRDDITFTLKTSEGDVGVKMPGDVFIHALVYSKDRSADRDQFWCYLNSDDNRIPQSFNWKLLGSATEEMKVGFCKTMIGIGFLLEAGTGKVKLVKDQWEVAANGKGWDCIRNGIKRGSIDSAGFQQVKALGGQKSLCAFEYSSSGLEEDPDARKRQLGFSITAESSQPVKFEPETLILEGHEGGSAQ